MSTDNYPSCIKIPQQISKDRNKQFISEVNTRDIKSALHFRNKLLSLANQFLGEKKWSHSIKSQTIDFIDSSCNKYIAGCTTIISVELHNGPTHEDIGYATAEEITKGGAIQLARIVFTTDALNQVLCFFGNEIQKSLYNLHTKRKTLSSITDTSMEYNMKNKKSNASVVSTKIVDLDISIPITKNTTFQTTSQKIQIEKVLPIKVQPDNISLEKIQPEEVESEKISSDVTQLKEVSPEKVLSETELRRLERKRKQMEKQMEFKRMMKMKEEQMLSAK